MQKNLNLVNKAYNVQILRPTIGIADFTRPAFVLIVRVIYIGVRLTQLTDSDICFCAVTQDPITCNTHKHTLVYNLENILWFRSYLSDPEITRIAITLSLSDHKTISYFIFIYLLGSHVISPAESKSIQTLCLDF